MILIKTILIRFTSIQFVSLHFIEIQSIFGNPFYYSTNFGHINPGILIKVHEVPFHCH